MALFDFDENLDDDWAISELPTIYGMIGQKAVPALAEYLANASAESLSRYSVVDCIKEIGKTHPDAKLECAQALSTQLEQFHHNPTDLNGFLISGLFGLRAIDHLPLKQEAFDNRRVDLSIAGDIEDVEIDLGLRKKRSTPRPSPFGEGEEFPFMFESAGSNQEPQTPKIGRNDPCPCGSGRKNKKCCLNK